MSTEKFNVAILLESLRETIVKDDVLLDQYCKSFEELAKLLPLFGKIFVFVSSDVREKLGILREHRNNLKNDSNKYLTISSMTEFEVTTGRLNSKDTLPNGSRTLLRLHRAMRFLEDLCRRLVCSHEQLTGMTIKAPRLSLISNTLTSNGNNSLSSQYFTADPTLYPPATISVSPNEHLSSMVRTAYDAHLSAHHTWVVRKAVQVAVHVLPSRDSLVRQIIELHAGTALPAGLLIDSPPASSTKGFRVADCSSEEPAFEDALSDSSPPPVAENADGHVEPATSTSAPPDATTSRSRPITEADVLPMMLLTCDLLAEIYGRVQRVYERHQLLKLP